MIQQKALNVVASFSIGAMIAAELLIPGVASAQTVTMNEAMLARCDAEGISPEACACWFAAIAEAEGLSEMSEEDIDALAPYYQEDLQACIDANG